MNQDDPSQGKLQEALASLRHRPPPRDLSARVRSRLQHPEPPPPPTLLQRLGLEIETRPVLVGLSGVAVCLLLIAVVLASRNVKPPVEAEPSVPAEWAGQFKAGALGQTAPPVAPGVGQGELPRSTDPLLVIPASADRVPMRSRVPATPPGAEPK